MGWNHIMLLYHADLKISHVAICVLHVLAKTADENNQCYPSAAYIAEKMNMSARSVMRGIQELGDAGLVIWKSGRGNRHVNRYQINVDNLARLINKYDTQSYLSEKEEQSNGHTVILNMTHSHIKYDTQSYGRRHKEDIKLVSMCPAQPDLFAETVDNSSAGQTQSPEELLAKPVKKRAEKAPSAPAMMGDYVTRFKTYGWKPELRKDIEEIVNYGYSLGLSISEAKKFVRFNNVRRWDAVSDLVSVHQLLKEWIDRWHEKKPGEVETEVSRRKEAKRLAEDERLRRQIEEEERGSQK